MGICQLVKAGESIPGRGNYRQRGRRQFHKFENPKVLWSGWYTGYKGEDVEQKGWRETWYPISDELRHQAKHGGHFPFGDERS